MPRRYFLPALALTVFAGLPALAQTALKDPQAVVLTSQAVSALNGTTSITDVSVQATVTYTAGSDFETGTATLEGHVGDQGRMVLNLSGGQRQEVRNGSAGNWSGTDGQVHSTATHNCWTDPTWFFPGLSLQAALNDPQVAIAYVGQENRGGATAYHLRFSRIIPGQSSQTTSTILRLSALDVYLDALSYLPLAIDFNIHPDDDFNLNIPIEIQFSDYRLLNGVRAPFHLQKLIQNGLSLDINVGGVLVNPGLPQTEFAVQ